MVWVVLCEACAAPESLEMHRKSLVFPEAVVKQLWGDETKWLQGSGGGEASNAGGVGTQITAQSQMCYRTKSEQRLWGGEIKSGIEAPGAPGSGAARAPHSTT